MQQKKIIHFLRAFSREEQKAFDAFLRSPYFNKNLRLITLWDYLKKFSPEYRSPKLTLEVVHGHMFGDTAFQEKRLDRLLLKLNKLAEAFIQHHSLRYTPEAGHHFLLTWFEARNLGKHHESQAKAFDTWLTDHTPTGYRPELARFFLEKSQSNALHREKQYAQSGVNLQEAMNALDQYYLVEKLMMATAMYARQSVLPVSYAPAFLDIISREIAEHPEAFSLSVQLWYKALVLTQAPQSRERYFALKTSLMGNLDVLEDPKDSSALFFILQNAVPYAIGQQSPDYYQELFDLYNLQIARGWILSTNGTILDNVFKNIVTVGTTLGEIDWTESFIASHAESLDEKYREDITGYCKALIAFEKGQYQDTLRLLAPLNRTNIFFDLSIRRLVLKVYFERKEAESLFSGINAYRVFLHRLDRITDFFKSANLAFLNIFSMLSRFAFENAEPGKLKAAEQAIHESASLPEREWLKAKVRALKEN